MFYIYRYNSESLSYVQENTSQTTNFNFKLYIKTKISFPIRPPTRNAQEVLIVSLGTNRTEGLVAC